MRLRLFAGLLVLLTACSAQPTAQTLPTPTPRPAPPSLEKPTYTVQRGEVVDKLEVSGFVSAKRQQELSFTQNGFLKVVYVERNSVVKKGDLLAELDLGELPNQLRQAEVSYDQAKLALDRVLAERNTAVRRAELDLADAQAALAKLQEAADPIELARAESDLRKAEIALQETRDSASAAKNEAELNMRRAAQNIPALQAAYIQALERFDEVRDKPQDFQYKPLQEAYLRAEAELRNAETALEQAKLAYENAQKAEITAVARAEQALADAQAELNDLKSGPKAADLAAARRQVERAQLALEEANRIQGSGDLEKTLATAQLEKERIEAQIAAGKLIAPFDGTIGQVANRPGDGIEAYRAVVTIFDDTERELLVDSVTSQDATKIGVGTEVSIIFSRHPGQTFNGIVTKLPTTATSSATTIDQDRAYHIDYTADVELDIGDLGRITIIIDREESALWLPPQAVRAFEGRRFVVVKDGDRQRRQDVRVGITSDERVEIREGVQEGDIIVGQ
ncbi:MAG: efflux RND transporter periplasmic adaptor subunit [Roseiflexaceae bacterium]